MALNEAGFSIIDLPAASTELLASYDNLPVDEYMGHGTRFKRFCQYRLSQDRDSGCSFELLPQRDYTTFVKFNPVAGGIRRRYEPVEVDFTDLLRAGVQGFPLDLSEDWSINLHQNRSQATNASTAPLTPEGVHHDGHDYVMIGVLRRANVGGALTRLWKPGADEPFWSGTIEEGQAVLLDDRAIQHDVTDVESIDGRPANRDIFIAAFSRWSRKWYGDEHDAKALADGTSGTTED
ncbi:2OG-Fe dioxygenase family protein [Lentzea albida]|uniref:2OG-Fe dioxygenase n=1 Tax=Lentzea albida TaxID=65499 RepID=A0A1H9PRV7_9PSEU|nr:2OG-Fe dioxygenase family protein [Lentzea albida]SER50545.1 hypothetical protein SAMN04488000_109219 [Lentzea albida]